MSKVDVRQVDLELITCEKELYQTGESNLRQLGVMVIRLERRVSQWG